MKELQNIYPVKPDSIGSPKIYLHANIQKVKKANNVTCWDLSSERYVKAAVQSVKEKNEKG